MLYSSQAHANSQMNKFLETMADWYKYADNHKKVVGFCAYVIHSSLAKLYAARYKLKSRAKVYRIASRRLSHPLKGKGTNVASEYSDTLKLGLVDAILTSQILTSEQHKSTTNEQPTLQDTWRPNRYI